jgi:Putative addiction module component
MTFIATHINFFHIYHRKLWLFPTFSLLQIIPVLLMKNWISQLTITFNIVWVKEQFFSLPPEERVALAEELWSSVEEKVIKNIG